MGEARRGLPWPVGDPVVIFASLATSANLSRKCFRNEDQPAGGALRSCILNKCSNIISSSDPSLFPRLILLEIAWELIRDVIKFHDFSSVALTENLRVCVWGVSLAFSPVVRALLGSHPWDQSLRYFHIVFTFSRKKNYTLYVRIHVFCNLYFRNVISLNIRSKESRWEIWILFQEFF